MVFKNLGSKESNNKDSIVLSIEFWEYIPVTVGVKKTTDAGSTQVQLTDDYAYYLQYRGSAPKDLSKTAKSPAYDSASYQSHRQKADALLQKG